MPKIQDSCVIQLLLFLLQITCPKNANIDVIALAIQGPGNLRKDKEQTHRACAYLFRGWGVFHFLWVFWCGVKAKGWRGAQGKLEMKIRMLCRERFYARFGLFFELFTNVVLGFFGNVRPP